MNHPQAYAQAIREASRSDLELLCMAMMLFKAGEELGGPTEAILTAIDWNEATNASTRLYNRACELAKE